jgi:hypothetical protein
VVDPAVGRLVGDRLNGARVAFAAQRLRWHQRQGRIRADVDIDSVALSLSGLSFSAGFFVRVIFEKERDDVHRVVREIAKVITRGIESERTPTAKP